MSLLYSLTLLAQNDSTTINNPNDVLLKNALQFQISSNFTLRSFQGSVISYKRNFSKRSALRFGLSLSTTFRSDERTDYFSPLDSIQSSRDVNDDLFSMIVRCQYVRQSPKKLNTTIFYGAGPLIGYEYNRTKSDQNNYNSESIYNNEVNTWRVGISFVLGAEWFIRKNMSLLAEYGLDALYEWRNDDSTARQHTSSGENKSVSERKSKIYHIGASSVKFGLSVYFY
jgi:hypothetical protein